MPENESTPALLPALPTDIREACQELIVAQAQHLEANPMDGAVELVVRHSGDPYETLEKINEANQLLAMQRLQENDDLKALIVSNERNALKLIKAARDEYEQKLREQEKETKRQQALQAQNEEKRRRELCSKLNNEFNTTLNQHLRNQEAELTGRAERGRRELYRQMDEQVNKADRARIDAERTLFRWQVGSLAVVLIFSGLMYWGFHQEQVTTDAALEAAKAWKAENVQLRKALDSTKAALRVSRRRHRDRVQEQAPSVGVDAQPEGSVNQ